MAESLPPLTPEEEKLILSQGVVFTSHIYKARAKILFGAGWRFMDMMDFLCDERDRLRELGSRASVT